VRAVNFDFLEKYCTLEVVVFIIEEKEIKGAALCVIGLVVMAFGISLITIGLKKEVLSYFGLVIMLFGFFLILWRLKDLMALMQDQAQPEVIKN
jgi:uncharacterized membrane protein